MPHDNVFKSIATKELTVGIGGLNFDTVTANETANVSITNVAPSGVTTATISAWLPIKITGTSTTYYIPLWT